MTFLKSVRDFGMVDYGIFRDEIMRLAYKHGAEAFVVPVLREEIWRASGSSHPAVHHYGDYGLAQHTLEVVTLCESTFSTYTEFSKRLICPKELFLSALFHDVGKAWDYSYGWVEERQSEGWFSNSHKYLIHHISRSCWEWRDIARTVTEDYEFIDRISHNILAHHGRKEWSSPVPPQSPEALILHYCDSISARLYESCRL